MAPVPERKMFPVDKEGFRQRQAWALRRRMTDMGVTAKMLANALDHHPDTASGWANGTYTMFGASVAAHDPFFQSSGDWPFFEERFGAVAHARLRPHGQASWWEQGG